MAIPTDELLQEDFSFPVQGYDIEQIRQSIANRIPLLGSQRGVYGLGIGSGGTNLAGGYIPSYNVATDPTYSSGFQYAQQIAGGMPFSQVVAPGMSFSPEQPGGYTQADLNVVNLPRDVAPVFPTPPATTGEVFEPTQPTMPYAPPGTLMPTIFGFQAPQFPPIDLSQLPEIDLSQITIPESVKSSLGELLGIPKIDVSQFVTREEIPSFIPPVQMPQIPQIDTSQFIGRQELPNILAGLPQAPQVDVSSFIGREELPSLLKDIPLNIPKIDTSQFVSREDISGLRSDILGSLPQVQLPDVSKFVTQADINKALATIPPAEQLDRQALIRDIQSQIKVPERFDPTALQGQISGLQQQIAGLPQPQQIDIGALRQDILSSVPQTNLAGYITESQLQQALQGIPKPTMPDVSQFVTQADINRAIAGIPQVSLSDIEARLAALESTPSIGVPKLPRPTGLFA